MESIVFGGRSLKLKYCFLHLILEQGCLIEIRYDPYIYIFLLVLSKKPETGEISFNNRFYLAQYVSKYYFIIQLV